MSGPRRVTVLIDSLIPGGAERVAVDAAAFLDPDRYVAHLLVTRSSGALEARVQELGLGYTILGRQRGFHPRLFAQARAIVGDSHILHAHKFAGSAWGSLLALSARRPLIAHEHIPEGESVVARRTIYPLLIGPTARRVVCVSTSIAEVLRRSGVPAWKLVVVPNGVPVAGMLERGAARAELGLDPDRVIVGMVARLRAQKRHDLALRTLAELRRRGRDVQLCVVGDGPLADDLRQLAQDLSIEDIVVFAGDRRDAGRLLPAFDVSLLTSSYEGMPLAVLEALVAGVTVVSTDLPVMRELLADGGGLIAKDDTPEGVADAVEAALDAQKTGIADAATLDESRRRFRIERLVDDLQALYDGVLGDAR